jgi:hypothetical protein
MRSRLAAEWEANGWEWDLRVGGILLDAISPGTPVRAEDTAAALPAGYLTRYATGRESVTEAVERAIGGEVLDFDRPTGPTVVVNGDSYTLKIGDQARVEGSSFNFGSGTQINIEAGADREELLSALRALLIAGLGGEWDAGAARAIGGVVEEQDLLTLEDIRGVVIEAGEASHAKPSRVKQLTEKVAVSGLGGFLAAGLSGGLADLFHLLG